MALKAPKPGIYEFSVRGGKGDYGPTETQTVIENGSGWTIKTDSGGNGGDAQVEMRGDGLYVTSQEVVLSNGERRVCSLPAAQLAFPNPLQSGRQWTIRASCPSGDLNHDTAYQVARLRVDGTQTITIGGHSVRVVRVVEDTVATTGPFVSRTHTVAYIDAALGIIVARIADTSGSYSEHVEETLAEFPAA